MNTQRCYGKTPGYSHVMRGPMSTNLLTVQSSKYLTIM